MKSMKFRIMKSQTGISLEELIAFVYELTWKLLGSSLAFDLDLALQLS